jgi:hypothetical protein
MITPVAAAWLIASGQQRGTSRRAQCSCVKLVIAQASLRKLVKGRRGDGTAECTDRAKADIVGQDQDDVRCALGCFDNSWKIGPRIADRSADHTFERLVGTRQCLLREGGKYGNRGCNTGEESS